jgi:hypothetical protein
MRYLFAPFTWLALAPASLLAAPFSHDLLDQVLQEHVDHKGQVDYAGLLQSRSLLDAYLDSLGQYSPRSHPARFPTPAHQLAYWINAYNAFVLRGVIDAYPVASVKDIMLFNGFFNRKEFMAGGEPLTLDHLENKIIRPLYQDPRIHFAVNCGARSCPQLERSAFTAADLDKRLEAALKRFAGDPGHVRLEGQTLYLSKILEWYGRDFVDFFPADRPNPPQRPAIVNYLLPYVPPEMARHLQEPAGMKIEFNEYDWALNDQALPKARGPSP